MPRFGHRDHLRRLQEFGVPGLSDVAVGQGWEPLSGPPFGGLLEADVRDITLALYGAPGGPERAGAGPTEFSDAYRGQLDDRAVIVANAWTRIGGRAAVAVCAVELACPVARLSVRPRRFPPLLNLPAAPVGRRAFDDRFLVQATPDGPVQQVLTPEAQQQMLARDDWFFQAGRGLLGCVGTEPFRSVDEVSQRISAVLAIAAAMSAAPVMSAPVTPPPPVPVSPVPVSPVPVSPVPGSAASVPPVVPVSPGPPSPGYPAAGSPAAGDLNARLGALTSLDEALAMLQALTPAERAVLAGLDTPLSALADVRTPQEATARYRTLDPRLKLQLAAKFMRPGAVTRRR